MSELYVVTTISNPVRYQSRFKLYADFRRRMEESGATLYTIELATGDHDFVVTQSDNPRHFQVRSGHEIWYKENLLNMAIGRLPKDWRYVAWLDADVSFVRLDWAEATLAQLLRHAFVQAFSHVVDLGPKFEPLACYEGFAYRYLDERRAAQTASNASDIAAPRPFGQPGYAWAARREELESVGGLIDWSILGANDYFMALGLIGELDEQSTRMPGSNYAATLLQWQEKCQKYVRRDIGYVDTTLIHYWHGSRKDRGYDTRWRILADNQFDPLADLRKDAQGLLELTGGKPRLRAAISAYFRTRNEDGAEA
ncbi:MAG: hypothetical protein ACHQAY_01735 [Hyphomicrobiales bacterium]